MVSLEQVKLLESKVTKAIDYVKKVTEENKTLKDKLDSYQKRIGELEVLIQQFKDEQGRIEDGILSALDRLNQFEDAVERVLSTEKSSAAVPSAETPTSGELHKEAKPLSTDGEDSQSNKDSASNEELDIF